MARFAPCQPAYRPNHCLETTSIDAEPSISSTETSDDGMLGFIVNDSASQYELRRPPPSMRKTNKEPPVGSIWYQRRIISDEEDDKAALILTTTKGTIELMNTLEKLILTSFTGTNPGITYNGALRTAISQDFRILPDTNQYHKHRKTALSLHDLSSGSPQEHNHYRSTTCKHRSLTLTLFGLKM